MNRQLKRIERQLEKSLKPVTPSGDFVLELRSILDQEMARKLKARRVQTGLLVAGGLVGGAVMIITMIRSLTTWPKKIQSLGRVFRKTEQTASI